MNNYFTDVLSFLRKTEDYLWLEDNRDGDDTSGMTISQLNEDDNNNNTNLGDSETIVEFPPIPSGPVDSV